MIEKIILALGASDSSMEVTRCMKSLRKLGVKKCLLLQCYSSSEESSSIEGIVGEIYNENIKLQKDLLINQGFDVETKKVKGKIENEINKIAEEVNAQMIVTKATNRSLIGDAVFKGLAYNVLHESEKPVMFVRPNYKSDPDTQCDITRHIMFPTDFSKNSKKAFEVLKTLSPCRGTKITLVHVQNPTRKDLEIVKEFDKVKEEDFAKLMDMKRELEGNGAQDVVVQLIKGSATTEIMNFIADEQVSLVIMGTQGLGFVKELYLGSLSHYVARHSSSSVLLV